MAENGAVLSHWYKLTEGLEASPLEFYAAVETALQVRRLPDIRTSRVEFSEGGILSAKREYLRVGRKEHTFDVCAAPFGTGFFVSWWLAESQGCLWSIVGSIPILGPAVERFFRPSTYYQSDTALMFQESVGRAVYEVIDRFTAVKGIRALTEEEKKPILRRLMK